MYSRATRWIYCNCRRTETSLQFFGGKSSCKVLFSKAFPPRHTTIDEMCSDRWMLYAVDMHRATFVYLHRGASAYQARQAPFLYMSQFSDALYVAYMPLADFYKFAARVCTVSKLSLYYGYFFKGWLSACTGALYTKHWSCWHNVALTTAANWRRDCLPGLSESNCYSEPELSKKIVLVFCFAKTKKSFVLKNEPATFRPYPYLHMPYFNS